MKTTQGIIIQPHHSFATMPLSTTLSGQKEVAKPFRIMKNKHISFLRILIEICQFGRNGTFHPHFHSFVYFDINLSKSGKFKLILAQNECYRDFYILAEMCHSRQIRRHV